MINFYSLTEDCHQVLIGKMAIYFSFKVPVAYRTKMHGLRVCESRWGPRTTSHIEMITLMKKHITMDKDGFNWSMKDQFQRAIWDLGKEFTLKRMGIDNEMPEVPKPSDIKI